MTENNSHADSGVPKALGAAVVVRHGIVFRTRAVKQQFEVPLEDAGCCCTVGIVGQED